MQPLKYLSTQMALLAARKCPHCGTSFPRGKDMYSPNQFGYENPYAQNQRSKKTKWLDDDDAFRKADRSA